MSVVRRSLMNTKAEKGGLYAVTKKGNAPVMAICYAQGWAANAKYMTFEEAAAVTDIGTAFRDNTITSFDEFQYFTGVTAIPNNAFNVTYSKLESIVLPPNITTIGSLAFRYCNFTQFTITSSIISVNANFLQDCPYLTKIIFDNNNVSVANVNWTINTSCNTIELGPNCTNFNVYDNCLYSLDYKTLYRCATYRSSITFHPNITNFANSALEKVRLTSLTIPSAITELPRYFASNSELSSVVFNNVTKLNNSAFSYSKFTSIDFSNTNINTLGGLDFRGTPITYIKISSSITSINNAFQDCKNVSTIICESTTPPSINSTGITSIYNNAVRNDLHIYVPDSSVNDYKTANVWSTLANYIYPISEYTPS